MPLAVKQGLRCNGLTDYVSAPIIPQLSVANNFSISMDVTLLDKSTGQTFLQNSLGGSDRIAMGAGASSITVGYFNGTTWTSKSFDNPQVGVKYNVNYVKDASGIHLFIDGVEKFGVNSAYSGTTGFFIGKTSTTGQEQYTNAIIHSFKAYDRNGVLLRKYDFNEGQGTTAFDTSGNGNNGTITGATWLIRKTPQKPKKNYIQNGGFDTDLSGWSKSSQSASWENGRAKIVGSSTNNYIYQEIPVSPGQIWSVGLDYQAQGLTGTTGTIKAQWFNGVSYVGEAATSRSVSLGDTANNRISMLTTSVPAGVTTLHVEMQVGPSVTGGSLWVDNIQVEQGSTATAYEPYQLVNSYKTPSTVKASKRVLAVAR